MLRKFQYTFLVGVWLASMILSLMFPVKSYADVIPEGHHSVDYSFVIQNIKDHPDYYYILSVRLGKYSVTYSPIYDNKNVNVYKFALANVSAINKNVSNIQVILENIEKVSNSNAGLVRSKEERAETKKYNDMLSKHLIHSNTRIKPVGTTKL